MKGVPLTPEQRQEIIDLRLEPHNHTYRQIADLTDRPYNTVAGILRAAGLQKETDQTILIVCDPRDLFEIGPTEFNQADLAYFLALSDPANGFSFTIGPHLITTRDGVYLRDDGMYCPPNKSGQLKWYKPKGAR